MSSTTRVRLRCPPAVPVIGTFAAGIALAWAFSGCMPGVPVIGSAAPEEIPLRTYRDSLLDLDLGYPEEWAFEDKTYYTNSGRTVDTYFEPINTLWTRRFTVKVAIPDRLPEDRTVGVFRREYLDRLDDRAASVRITDTGWTSLGGRPAWLTRYDVVMDGKPFTRHADWITVKDGRDFSLAFEVSVDHAEPDIVLFGKIAERFRFYRP